LIKPKCSRKYGALTTPPLGSRLNQQISDIRTKPSYAIPLYDRMRTRSKVEDRQTYVSYPKSMLPQNTTNASPIEDQRECTVRKRDRPTVNPAVLEYTLYLAFHPGTVWLRGKSAEVIRSADRCILITYHAPRLEVKWEEQVASAHNQASVRNELSRQRAE
jgi:hypothetical protein